MRSRRVAWACCALLGGSVAPDWLILPALVQSEISGDGEPTGAGTSPRELIIGVALGEGVAEAEGDI